MVAIRIAALIGAFTSCLWCDQTRNNVGSLTTFSTQVVPLVIVGEGWSQKIALTNVDDKDAAIGTIRFFRANGQAWTISLLGRGSASVQLINLQPGATAVFETEIRQTEQELGWALIELSSGALGDIFGQSIFRKQTSGRPDFMTSTPFSHYAFERLHHSCPKQAPEV